MKQLSIEEKAKAYDERLAKARKEYSIHEANNAISIIDALERVFPELKESGDERTWIINYLSNRILNSTIIAEKENLKRAIDWLEKQGKNDMGISEATKKELEDKLHKALEKETPESCNEFLEKQGEQKPVENSAKVSESSTEEKDMGEYKKGFECGKQRVLKYPEDFGLCKKHNWSEEDENRINRLIAYFEDKESFTAEDDVVYANWLKSLKDRVQWKPSEEQMKVINTAISQVWTKQDGEQLMSLYKDLKKLRGEDV